MTTFVNFAPTATSAFQFPATLDGDPYAVIVSWNVYAQRYYINIYSASGDRIVTEPMIASPTPLPLAAPPSVEAVESMTWSSDAGGTVAFVMVSPSPFVLGDEIDVSGAVNSGTAGDGAVNGLFVINTWTDSQHFTALLTASPGEIGAITGDIVIDVGSQALVWNLGVVTATTSTPHNFALGTIVDLTIAGANPDGYNGRYSCTVTGPTTFTYPLAADPGIETVPGTYSPDISLVDGYFTESTMIWREDAQRFEINP